MPENRNESHQAPSGTALNPGSADVDSERVDAGPDGSLRLQEISTLLVHEGGLDSFYERLLDAAVDLMSADRGSMQTFHPELGELKLLASRGFHPESVAFWERVHLDSACCAGKALSKACRIIVPDTETCGFMAGTSDLDAYRQSNIRAVQSTPLVSRSGRLLGMISTHWREPHQPTKRELRSLDVLARQAADLIENSEAVATLRESEQRVRWLASITESSDDAIISQTLDGFIVSWNQGAERLFGYPAEEMIGMPIAILIPPDRQHEERVILEKTAGGERIKHFETVRRRRDGSLAEISLTVSPVKNVEGRIIGASKIARDIAERKQAEGREKALTAQLAHMNRVATAGELSASIAHEVSQPLSEVLLWAKVALRSLASEPPGVGEAGAALTEIVSAGKRAGDVILSVGAMFRKVTEQKTPLDINVQIRSVLAIVKSELRRQGIESRISLGKNLPPVNGNEVQLQQVILNLMMNAIESMLAGEPRILSVKSKTTELNRVRVSIADTGGGLDPANIERIFQPLFTTKEKGMGMGLSICQTTIKNHNGRIWVSPVPHKGSIFHFELPAAGDAAVATAA